MENGKTKRFSDKELSDFHTDFKKHLERFEEHESKEDERFASLLEIQERNTKSLETLISETRDIVQLHKDLQSAARLGTKIQKIGIWLIKWPLISAGIYSIYKWFRTWL